MSKSESPTESKLLAGFAEVEITPTVFPANTYWTTVDTVIDPLYARASVFEGEGTTVAFLSLDVVILDYPYVVKIRKMVAASCGIPADCLMVSATHNHACPAVVERSWMPRDEAYMAKLVQWGAKAVKEAYDRREQAEIGTGTCFESRISFNRRFILKNGSIVSQPSFDRIQREVLYGEAIIDPELGVLCVRDANHKLIGLLVNFSCHPVHLMGQLSSGFPGVLCNRLKEAYGQEVVTLYLNGACGNVHHNNWADPDYYNDKETVGNRLAEDVQKVVETLEFTEQVPLAAEATSIPIRYRDIVEFEKNLNNLEAYNVFDGLIKKNWYPWSLEKLKAMHAVSDHEMADLQVIRIGDAVFGAIPAEYFSQDGLQIKERSPVDRTFVVTLANGWLGYIPNSESFSRIGGHESTWCISSKMEAAAGDQLADGILELIDKVSD